MTNDFLFFVIIGLVGISIALQLQTNARVKDIQHSLMKVEVAE